MGQKAESPLAPRVTEPDQQWYVPMRVPSRSGRSPKAQELYQRLNRDGWPRFRITVESDDDRVVQRVIDREGGVRLVLEALPHSGPIREYPPPEQDLYHLLEYQDSDGSQSRETAREAAADPEPMDPALDQTLRLDLLLPEIMLETARLAFLARLGDDPEEREAARSALYEACQALGVGWRGHTNEAWKDQHWMRAALCEVLLRGKRLFGTLKPDLGAGEAAARARSEIEPSVHVLLFEWEAGGGSVHREHLRYESQWQKIFESPGSRNTGALKKTASKLLGVDRDRERT